MVKSKLPFCVLVVVISILSCKNNNRNPYPEELVGGFELLTPELTGIDFNNTVKESKTFNHYFYSQIYLGSGVAIGDINNDGLPDVFFGGNQVSDRLYLNKGDFQFEDITKTSRIGKNPGWSWGVTMVDINADGYLDIYISRNGSSLNLDDRRNQLYINNQDETFTESAIKYGLADVGFSTQAVFFDMDNDGDLDAYQVNQPLDRKVALIHEVQPEEYKFYRDRLYENVGGKFRDVSETVGISRDFAHGLSVNASDFNNDGWIDLYVANDYAEPDFMYYNNGDGTFKNVINEKLKHITNLSMGSDTGDVNNDGFMDLMTTDMTPEDHYRSKTNMASMSTEAFNTIVEAGAHYQYMANALQINTGVGSFYDIANLAKVSNTDWSWASLIVDMDNDGWKDIMVSNGIKKDLDNNDYRNILKHLDPKSTTAEDLFQLSKDAPSQRIANYAFKNKGNMEFEKVAKAWGFDTPSFSSGMAYGDLDNDGDLDVVINNMDAPAFVYKNKATGNFLKIQLEGPQSNRFGYGAKAIIHSKLGTQMVENTVTRGYLSSVESGLFFGLGKDVEVEKVEVIWPDGKVNYYENIDANQTLLASHAKSQTAKAKVKQSTPSLFKEINPTEIGINYEHKENKFDDFEQEILLPHKLSENGPFSAVADVNGDGLEDIFIGGAAGQSGVLYTQNTEGKFKIEESQPWHMHKDSEDLGCLFLDVENDGDQDLYIASGGNEFKKGDKLLKDRLYINDGNGVFTYNNKALPLILESSQSIQSADIDNDGDLDLFVGTRLISGKYPHPATSYLLINNGGFFRKAETSIAPALEHMGMVTDAVFTDIDQDGDQDLMIVGEWMTITLLINDNGTFKDSSENYGLSDTRGMWWSITASDLDNDGDDDYIVGNLGRNNKFKATKEHPFKVYANDFDDNGTNDVVLAKFYKDDYVPVRGRECTSQQMPYVSEKFKDYNSFASSKLLEILPEDKVKGAVVYEISNFESICLINDNGTLTRKALPIQAQISPVKSSMVSDFNGDGKQDIMIVGNHYGVEVETTRYDAGHGAIFLGDGENNFKFITPTQSGFYTPNDSRSITAIGNQLIITTNNNARVQIFQVK